MNAHTLIHVHTNGCANYYGHFSSLTDVESTECSSHFADSEVTSVTTKISNDHCFYMYIN